MKNNKWFLMSEVLPEKHKLVLCQGERNGLFIGKFYGFEDGESKQYAHVPNARVGRYAIAWQELPEPLSNK